MKTLLVIFGITGDLSSRKLLPALSHIINDSPSNDLSILGVSRRQADVKQLIMDATSNQAVVDCSELYTMDLAAASDYAGLKVAIGEYKADQTLIYLSVPPGAAAQIVDFLGEAGINGSDVHLLFEKPFGYDLQSAKGFFDRTARYYTEEQIYRIDHYMAKEVSAELVRLRRDAETHHHNWGAASIASVDVVASESIGIEGRADFYEQTGALRDFIQGHLMQLLSLVLMDIAPHTTDDQLPDLRRQALSMISAANPDDAVRAQYQGYQDEVNNIGSTTETFASVTLTSTDDHWKGVPLRLITGKSLDAKSSRIVITYTDGTTDIFEEVAGVSTDERKLDAYERVLLEAIAGRKALFTSGGEVLRSWEIVSHVQQSWAMNNAPLQIYLPGSSINDIIG
jgi:glucose-6-phosphate 1-dehydrogenase